MTSHGSKLVAAANERRRLKTELDQMTARVAELEEFIERFTDTYCGVQALLEQTEARRLLNRTPAQSLNDIKADALEEVAVAAKRAVFNGWTCHDYLLNKAAALREGK